MGWFWTVGVATVLFVAAVVLMALGLDHGSFYLGLNGIVFGAGGAFFGLRDLRLALKKRGLRREIEAGPPDDLIAPTAEADEGT